MNCTVVVNSTDINRSETLIDDLNLRFTFTTEYQSKDVAVEEFIDDVATAYAVHYRAKERLQHDHPVYISTLLWMKIVYHSTCPQLEKKYFLSELDKDDRFETVGDLLPYSQISYSDDNVSIAINNDKLETILIDCKIYMEVLPICRSIADELITLFLKQIPVELIDNKQITATSTEWDDLDCLLVKYVDWCKDFTYDNDVTAKTSMWANMYDYWLDHVCFDSLWLVVMNSLKIGNPYALKCGYGNPTTKIICRLKCILDHLLHLCNVYGTCNTEKIHKYKQFIKIYNDHYELVYSYIKYSLATNHDQQFIQLHPKKVATITGTDHNVILIY